LGVVNKGVQREAGLYGRVRRVKHPGSFIAFITILLYYYITILPYSPHPPPEAPTLPQLEFSGDKFPQVQTTLQASSFDPHQLTDIRPP
jgi:hypothetical protein